MSIGGPASFGIGLLGGFLRSQQQGRQRANAASRAQLELSLKQLKERRLAEADNEKDQRAIARSQAALNKATIKAGTAQAEIDDIHGEIEHNRASPGAPYKDAALEGRLHDAHADLDAARETISDHQQNMMKVVADRNARIEASVPNTMPGSGLGGFAGFGTPSHDTTPAERGQAILNADRASRGMRPLDAEGKEVQGGAAPTPSDEDTEFDENIAGGRKNLAKSREAERKAQRNIGGIEAQEGEGRLQQDQINEDRRVTREGTLRERERAAQDRADVQKAGMAAAAEEISRRQGDISGRDMPQPPTGGMPGFGAATGKGGGAGGLLGAATGKAGGMGSPQGMVGAQGAPGASQGLGGAVGPTAGQAIGPVAGQLLQMPAPQAAQVIRQVLGGMIQPSRGGPVPASNSTYDPRTGAFTGRNGMGAATGKGGSTASPSAATPGGSPRRPPSSSSGTNHFHFHQAGSGSRGDGAPMPPRRPDFQGQGVPGGQFNFPGGQAPDPPRRPEFSAPRQTPPAGQSPQEPQVPPRPPAPPAPPAPAGGTPMPPRRPDFSAPQGQGERQPAKGAGHGPQGPQWYHAHPVVPDHVIEQARQAPQDQGRQQQQQQPPITQQHIDFLKANPSLAPAFDKKFGPGSSAVFLGGGA